MPLQDFVNTQLSSTGPAVTEEGFGTPMILADAVPAGFVERVREYAKPADMVTDGFSASDSAYKMASILCSQSPRPPTFKVGRLALPPTQHWTLTPTASNSTKYTVTIDGTAYSITSDGTATATEIVTALTAAFGSIAGLTFGGTSTLTITGTVSTFHTVSVTPAMSTLIKVAQDHSDAGAATDLDAILLEDADWYCVLNPLNSAATATAIAGWAETNKKLFIAASQDTEMINHALSGATDLAAALHTAADFYSSVQYTPSNGDFLDAALAGLKLTSTPGSEVWALTTLSGVSAVKLTATQRANLLAKKANFYESNVAGRNVTVGGKVASGEWIDVVRGKDWQANHIDSLVFACLTSAAQTNSKVSYTDTGLALLQGVVQGALKDGVDAGLLASNPAPAVQVPLASAVSVTDKGNRILTTMTFTATLAGAIVAVNPIKGTITV